MSRKTSTLLSLGLSAVLIAVGVWILYHHSLGFGPGHGRWFMGQGGMMGGGMGLVMIIFWMVLIAALVLLFSGAVNGLLKVTNKPKMMRRIRWKFSIGVTSVVRSTNLNMKKNGRTGPVKSPLVPELGGVT